MRILVTGSAKLDYYRHGGDSLQGRYHLLHLHPLSVAELGIHSPADFKALLTLRGFPEPFYGGSEVQARRWSRDYRSRLLEENLLGLESVHDIGSLEQMMIRLPTWWGARFPKAGFWQITAEGTKDFKTTDGIRVCPAGTFLRQLV